MEDAEDSILPGNILYLASTETVTSGNGVGIHRGQFGYLCLPYFAAHCGIRLVKTYLVEEAALKGTVKVLSQIGGGDKDTVKIFHLLQNNVLDGVLHFVNGIFRPRFPSVMISPYDQDYIQGGSELRRRYFDSVVSQLDHAYLDGLVQYNRLLMQRNALLKQAYDRSSLNPADFEVWDERLSQFGVRLHDARAAFLEQFLPVFLRYFRQIADDGETAEILYESSLDEQPMSDGLRESLQRDYYSGVCFGGALYVGQHRIPAR